MDIKRGDVWYVEKNNETIGHEQWSGRPAIIVSSEDANTGGTVEVVYLTTKPKPKSNTNVSVFACNKFSTAICEQISTVDKRRMKRKTWEICQEEMDLIDQAMAKSLGIYGRDNAERKAEPEAEYWKVKYETTMECYSRALEVMK